jgi:hypothetical protein
MLAFFVEGFGAINHDGHHLYCSDRRLLRRHCGLGAFLRQPAFRWGATMNWVYWLSGGATLLIFVYLIVALFKPELFE